MTRRNRRISALDNDSNGVVDFAQNTNGEETEMVVADRELLDDVNVAQDADDDENPESETAKRERVNLETLPPDTKVMLSIAIPAGMKLALTKLAEAESISASAFSRNVLAGIASYTVPASFTERTRTRKYATKEEAQNAAKAKAKTQRELMKEFLAMAQSDPELQAKLTQAKAAAEAKISAN